MIDWKSLTPDARNQLVAVHLFVWQPEPCSQRFHEVWSEPGIQWQCPACGACAENAERIEHQPINPYPDYSRDMNAALLILDLESVWGWSLHSTIPHGQTQKVYACDIYYAGSWSTDDIVNASANTPQDAICIAVLRASGLEVQQ